MSGYTKWCVLCWGQRLRDDYPGLDPRVVEKAGGKVVKCAAEGAPVAQVMCLSGTIWKTASIRAIPINESFWALHERAEALRAIKDKLGINPDDCMGAAGYHLLYSATEEP
jgi:hypothetical protein